jgi:hypothetical protein
MQDLISRAKEDQELFWLSMGFFSSDGEKDEDFKSEDDYENNSDSNAEEQEALSVNGKSPSDNY